MRRMVVVLLLMLLLLVVVVVRRTWVVVVRRIQGECAGALVLLVPYVLALLPHSHGGHGTYHPHLRGEGGH